MSYEHNFMAHKMSAQLLSDVRQSRAAWANAQLSTRTTLWQGMADWPRPDITFQDTTLDASIAFEFKPPSQPKREYVTGMGQALTYLNDFKYAGLVLPTLADDGFKIADYIGGMFTGLLSTMPVAIFSYDNDPSRLTVVRTLQARMSAVKIPSGTGRRVFWGYWRDLSNHELFEMLRLLDAQKRPNFDSVFGTFWSRFATKGRALTWEGRRRKAKSASAKGKMGEQINVRQAMRHAGLLDSDERLTAEGYRLLHVGKIYGPDSAAFMENLAAQVLTTARHLDLIFWIEEQQRLIPANLKRDAQSYYRALDLRLEGAGIIAAPARGASKATFLRDEPKLWNKLGLLTQSGSGRYFHAGYGLAFDWRKIISVIESN